MQHCISAVTAAGALGSAHRLLASPGCSHCLISRILALNGRGRYAAPNGEKQTLCAVYDDLQPQPVARGHVDKAAKCNLQTEHLVLIA